MGDRKTSKRWDWQIRAYLTRREPHVKGHMLPRGHSGSWCHSGVHIPSIRLPNLQAYDHQFTEVPMPANDDRNPNCCHFCDTDQDHIVFRRLSGDCRQDLSPWSGACIYSKGNSICRNDARWYGWPPSWAGCIIPITGTLPCIHTRLGAECFRYAFIVIDCSRKY